MQQRIKIVEAYFCHKINGFEVTQRQCRREFGRDKGPDTETIERLAAKFRETESVANANIGLCGRSHSVKTFNNVQNLRERLEKSPGKSNCCLSKAGLFRSSDMRILYDLKLFPYKIQILQRQTDDNKAERLAFCRHISQRTKTILV